MVTASEDVPRRPGRRRRVRTRGAPPAPAARFEPGRTAAPTQRSPVWLLAGLLLVLLSALGGVVLFSTRDDRHGALVAAQDLAPGHVVQRTDFRTVELALDGNAATIAPEAVDQLVGLRVTGFLPAGTLVHPGLFTAVAALGPDEMEVGAALDAGEFPLRTLTIGGAVELLVTAAPEPGGGELTTGEMPDGTAVPEGSTSGVVPAASLGPGTVTAVEERATGQLLVTVRVTRDVGVLAVAAARADRLTLAIVGEGGG